jgi:hypothetical protein
LYIPDFVVAFLERRPKKEELRNNIWTKNLAVRRGPWRKNLEAAGRGDRT